MANNRHSSSTAMKKTTENEYHTDSSLIRITTLRRKIMLHHQNIVAFRMGVTSFFHMTKEADNPFEEESKD